MALEGRCMKCKESREMKDVEMHKTSRGGFMAKGKCSVCGCGMCKIRSAADAEADMAGGVKKAF